MLMQFVFQMDILEVLREFDFTATPEMVAVDVSKQ